MKKEVIYIDIEDDITAIIGKIKAVDAKIVALVPPKRIGVLQSVVNLKLLQKSAGEATKHLVLITSDQSLSSLAAGVKIPVAKNLQSKPEIPEIPVLAVDNDDIINGEELPVGEIANAIGPIAKPTLPSEADAISDHIDLGTLDAAGAAPVAAKPSAASKPKSGKPKIPNFNMFRKKLFLIGGGAILLGGVLFWALVIAPHATVTVSAKTFAVNIDRTLNLNPAMPASQPDDLELKPIVRQLKKATSVEFDATGTKDVGQKASGIVSLSNSFDSNPMNLPAGTALTAASGQKFVSKAAVTVPGATVSGGGIKPGTADVGIEAIDIGPGYNIPAQSYTVQDHSNLGATGQAMTGGTKDTVTIVSQADVDKAKSQLAQQDITAAKAELRKQFSGDIIIIEESFIAEQGQPSASPAVDEQSKRGKVTVETTNTLVALTRDDVRHILDNSLKVAMQDKPDQGVFSNGENTIQFQSFQKAEGGTFTAHLITTGYIGTKIDTAKLAQQLTGKRYGEIQQIVNQLSGVTKVDINFSPFWVSKAPGDPHKIDIKFSVLNDTK